ncbi:hypothetical protein C0560_16025 [Lelliottia sp. AC1]|nr:hypothetical protein C0560_16025 [Lelliottia sp. AC1]
MRAFRTSTDDSGIIFEGFWWSWGDLNPRPKFLHTIFITVQTVVYVLKQCVSILWCLSVLCVFNALPPNCRHLVM